MKNLSIIFWLLISSSYCNNDNHSKNIMGGPPGFVYHFPKFNMFDLLMSSSSNISSLILRELMSLPEGHKESKLQGWNLNPGLISKSAPSFLPKSIFPELVTFIKERKKNKTKQNTTIHKVGLSRPHFCEECDSFKCVKQLLWIHLTHILISYKSHFTYEWSINNKACL